MFRKTSAMKSYNFLLTFAMIHGVEIAFLFISFKRLRLEREQIREILLDLKQLTSDTSFTLEDLSKAASGARFSVCEAALLKSR